MMKEAKIYNGEKIASSINGVGKTGKLHAKISKGLLSHAIQKNKIKMDYRVKCKT